MSSENYIMPFGKHKGKTLKKIYEEGDILYLDWLRGERDSDKKKRTDALDNAVCLFLDQYEDEVESALADRDEEMNDRTWGDRPEDHF